MKKSRSCLLAALSAGWLAPLYLVGTNFRAYLETELLPNITGRPLTHSFPILDFGLRIRQASASSLFALHPYFLSPISFRALRLVSSAPVIPLRSRHKPHS